MRLGASVARRAVVPKRYFIVDFDGTCTATDTTGLIPRLASEHTGRTGMLGVWSEIEREFFELTSAAEQELMASRDMQLTLDDALAEMDSVSNTSTRKVSESKCLAGIVPERVGSSLESLEQGQVQMRSGCVDVLAGAEDQGWELGVLSVNWCPPIIDAMLLGPLRRRRGHRGGDANISPVACWSNSIDPGSGQVRLVVPGAAAKKDKIESLKLAGEDGGSVVYVGDSPTDLPALIAADIGVLIGDSKSARAFAEKFGVALEPLSDAAMRRDGEGGRRRRVVWVAEDWAHIDRVVIRPGS